MIRKVCLITGGNAGIGRETALGLARKGMQVVIVSRDYLLGRDAVEYIRKKSNNNKAGLITADLSSQKQIHNLADEFKRNFNQLDVLINNAAAIMPFRTLTEDGIEYQLAVNHLAPFLITNLLIELLIDSAPSRIINVSSQTHRNASLNFNDLSSAISYNPASVYASTKLMNVLFTYKMARMLKGTGVTVNCLHPGVASTKLFQNYSGKFGSLISKIAGKSSEKGARTSVYLASDPEVEKLTGKYFSEMQERESSPLSYDKNMQDRLWEISSDLCGVHKSV